MSSSRVFFFALITAITLCNFAWSNNLIIKDVQIVSGNKISFSISWENSWNISNGPTNHDAVWVFVKYQDCSTKVWSHANLNVNSSNHSSLGGNTAVSAVTDGNGVFVKRSDNGTGTSTGTITLSMNLTDKNYNYQVLGVEMVYIPEAAFYIGDGGSGATFKNASGLPVEITKEIQDSKLLATQYNSGDGVLDLPSTFPMGYYGFYSMKYEISQEQYVSFLNTLTYIQQVKRTTTSPANLNALAMPFNGNSYRNGIKVKEAGISNDIPAKYGCDLNNNNTYDEANDGGSVACNLLTWKDVIAFLEWAALRPMTELEFEKICRGPSENGKPMPLEFPWGSRNVTQANASDILAGTSGTNSESVVKTGGGLCNFNNHSGPLRCGFAATSSSSREQAGATYYGAMEMGGNVWELTISVSKESIASLNFTDGNGNGELSMEGEANTSSWPINALSKEGFIIRGGSFRNTSVYLQVSDRIVYKHTTLIDGDSRNMEVGGRGVRSFR